MPVPDPRDRRRPSGATRRASLLDIAPLLRRRWTLTSLWGICLPLSIALVSGSILLSGGDPAQRPFLIFGAGVVCGVIGLASLFVGLIEAGNKERARRAERDRARAAASTGDLRKP